LAWFGELRQQKALYLGFFFGGKNAIDAMVKQVFFKPAQAYSKLQ
jgi:hypothetical protein